MEPLFTTKTAYTFEEYKKFNYALFSKQLKLPALSGFAFLLWLLIIIYCIAIKEYYAFILAAVTVMIIIFIIPVTLNKSIKKTYYSNKTISKTVCEFEFYEKEIIEKTPDGSMKVKYENLYKIIETKTNLYLMIAQNQGFIIVKENCSPELIEFIKQLKV